MSKNKSLSTTRVFLAVSPQQWQKSGDNFASNNRASQLQRGNCRGLDELALDEIVISPAGDPGKKKLSLQVVGVVYLINMEAMRI